MDMPDDLKALEVMRFVQIIAEMTSKDEMGDNELVLEPDYAFDTLQKLIKKARIIVGLGD